MGALWYHVYNVRICAHKYSSTGFATMQLGKTSETKGSVASNQIKVSRLQICLKASQPEPLSHWSLQHPIIWKHWLSSWGRNDRCNNYSEGRKNVGFLDHLMEVQLPYNKNETIWMLETLHRHSDSTFLCCFLAEWQLVLHSVGKKTPSV